MSEMARWRNRAVCLPSHSSRSLCISSFSSSRGKPASAVVAQTFWSGSCFWYARRWRSSMGVRMMSPSVGNLGSVVLSASPFWVLRVCGDSDGAGNMRSNGTPSSTSPSSYVMVYVFVRVSEIAVTMPFQRSRPLSHSACTLSLSLYDVLSSASLWPCSVCLCWVLLLEDSECLA